MSYACKRGLKMAKMCFHVGRLLFFSPLKGAGSTEEPHWPVANHWSGSKQDVRSQRWELWPTNPLTTLQVLLDLKLSDSSARWFDSPAAPNLERTRRKGVWRSNWRLAKSESCFCESATTAEVCPCNLKQTRQCGRSGRRENKTEHSHRTEWGRNTEIERWREKDPHHLEETLCSSLLPHVWKNHNWGGF